MTDIDDIRSRMHALTEQAVRRGLLLNEAEAVSAHIIPAGSHSAAPYREQPRHAEP